LGLFFFALGKKIAYGVSAENAFFDKGKLDVALVGGLDTIKALAVALQPEASDKKHRDKRCHVRIRTSPTHAEEKSSKLSMSFESSDLASLRASFNSNLRLLASALRTLEATRETNH